MTDQYLQALDRFPVIDRSMNVPEQDALLDAASLLISAAFGEPHAVMHYEDDQAARDVAVVIERYEDGVALIIDAAVGGWAGRAVRHLGGRA